MSFLNSVFLLRLNSDIIFSIVLINLSETSLRLVSLASVAWNERFVKYQDRKFLRGLTDSEFYSIILVSRRDAPYFCTQDLGSLYV